MNLAATWYFAPFFSPLRRESARPRIVAAAPRQQLQKGATFVVPAPKGSRVTCVQGSVWITHDADPKDVVLAAGQVYEAQRESRMLVHAFEDSAVWMH